MFASQDRALTRVVIPSAADGTLLRRTTADRATAPAPDQPVVPAQQSRARGVASGGTEGAPGPSDDSWRLTVLLAVFVVAPLVVVLAVWAVAAIGTLWALVFALAVYLTMTVIVFAAVAFVLSDHLPLSGRHRHGD
jgi:hypothetical protein